MVFSFLRKRVAHFYSPNVLLIISTGFVIVLLFSSLPGADSHISSILGTGRKRVLFGKHVIFCDFSSEEDGMPPLLSHIRVSRGPSTPTPSTSEEESNNAARLHFLKSPSLQHKLLRHLSIFPDGYVARMGSRSRNNEAANEMHLDTRPNLTTKIKGALTNQNNDYEGDGTYDDVDDNHVSSSEAHKFSSYISARVLSNIPRFFDHVKENLKALRHDRNYGTGTPPSPTGEYITEDGLSKKGKLRRNKFNEASKEEKDSNHTYRYMDDETYLKNGNNYNPAWLFTNLGLGKRGGAWTHVNKEKKNNV